MIWKTSLFAALALALAVIVDPAVAGRRGEQDEARQDMAAGKVKSLREIESSVVPRMRGMQYLGPEYDPTAQVYRLKFINRDRVIFVDVDGRTGGVLRQR
jgi:membrane protein implicated in regulation of membrane protease activity